MNAKKIPYNFVFDYLVPLKITAKSMFGMYFIYTEEKIVLILRERENYANTNGVWVATSKEHHKSLKKELPSLCSLPNFANEVNETEWQMIPSTVEDFEEAVIKVCDLIVKKDPRIGRVPKPKRKK